jgi:hypothetical protein
LAFAIGRSASYRVTSCATHHFSLDAVYELYRFCLTRKTINDPTPVIKSSHNL